VKRLVVVVMAIGLVGLVACSSDGGSSTGSEDEVVKTSEVDLPKSYRFAPESIEVSAGSTVTWTNNDNFVHNVHLLDGSDTTKDLPIGAKEMITFDTPGTYKYQCSLHPAQMQGEVIVT
jgi:plastocyanin